MIRPLHLPPEAFERALDGLRRKLPWGSSDLDLILGHVVAVEDELAELRAIVAARVDVLTPSEPVDLRDAV